MQSPRLFPLCAALGLSLAACAAGPDGQTPSCDDSDACDAKDPASESEAEINGLPAREYYAQLFYTVLDTDSVPHRALSTFTVDPRLTPREGERSRRADLSLFLIPNGSYVLDYQELVAIDAQTSEVENEILVEGNWSVEGLSLVLGDLGIGSGVDFNGQPGLSLKIERDIGSEGLAGQQVQMDLTRSSWGLDECSGNSADPDKCPVELP